MAFFISLFGAIITSNAILSGTKGLCSYLGLSKDKKAAVGMGLALTLVCVLSGALCYGISFATAALNATYLNTIIFILVIASFVQLIEILIKRFLPSLYKALGIYLPLITTNCVVLGLALSVAVTDLVTFDPATIATAFGTILGTPLGYFLVIYIFNPIQERIQNNPSVPRGFKGPAIALICTAGMVLAFMGLTFSF